MISSEIKEEINIFLSSPDPEILSITGLWGVGKTYLWNTTLNAKIEDISLTKYSYISLFGINSLDELKKQIIFNTIEFKSENNTTIKKLREFFRKFNKIKIKIPYIENSPSLIEYITFSTVQETLICIDDIERRGKNLELNEILGLSNFLKDSKKCKIVLLINDKEENSDYYRIHHEKVIDVDLKFSPTPEECCEVVFPPSTPDREYLIDQCKKLNINNIRIIRKIFKKTIKIYNLIENYEKNLIYTILTNITIFIWSNFSSNKEIPTTDYILDYGKAPNPDDYFYDSFIEEEENRKNKKPSDEELMKKNWNHLISNAGYISTNNISILLERYIKTGIINKKEFIKSCEMENNIIKLQKSQSSYSEAWGIYHNNFKSGKQEVIDALLGSFNKNCKGIEPHNLAGTVRLLKELNESEKASEIIDFYIKENSDDINKFNTGDFYSLDSSLDNEIIDKFNNFYLSQQNDLNIKDVLDEILSKGGFNKKHEEYISSLTENDIFNFLINTESIDLSDYVRKLLAFGNAINATDNQRKIRINVVKALIRVGKISDINRLKVKKFGIEV